MPPEKLIPADKILSFTHQIPSSKLQKIYGLLNIEAGNREELFKQLKERVGNLSWDAMDTGLFHHERTQTIYALDEIGFKYETGYVPSDEEALKQQTAPTFTHSNGLVYWIRDKVPYLVEDTLPAEGGNIEVKFMSQRSYQELGKVLHIHTHGAVFREMGAKKLKPNADQLPLL